MCLSVKLWLNDEDLFEIEVKLDKVKAREVDWVPATVSVDDALLVDESVMNCCDAEYERLGLDGLMVSVVVEVFDNDCVFEEVDVRVSVGSVVDDRVHDFLDIVADVN